jgi:hypothetical protein
MARDPKDESIRKHREWLGYLQPVGLVVSAPALADADCHVNDDIATEYQRFLAVTADGRLPDLPTLFTEAFDWRAADLVPADDPRAAALVTSVEVYGETLRPTFAVPDDLKATPPTWLMLVQQLPPGTTLDAVGEVAARQWQATPQVKFERLLRETQIPAGLLATDTELRLVYYPRGESSGHVTFPVATMREVAGRPAFAALHALLNDHRVFSAPDGKRLTDVLLASRKYQNTVSTELSKQVLAALYELVRGIQAADAQAKGDLLREVLARDPDQVYAGLLTVLLRLVFVLYAEDRGLMSDTELYVRNYSVSGLFEKLRSDAGRHADTMDQRYGAWARLLSLFRIVHDGAKAGPFHLPPRHGYLFDPDRYPFLEGRPVGHRHQPSDRLRIPRVPDGVVHRVLENLLMLDGERLSYRALDVEQIGSVYEAMMGFRVETAVGRSIALRPKKTGGAPVTINLDAVLAEKPADRAKFIKEQADQAVEGKGLAALKDAKTPEDVVAALDRKVAKDVTPNIVPPGSMVLQPSDERRRSGSHYTPRSLTEPIVRKALEPILAQLGENPTPERILLLKVCDPAMGSGAFLVEACRQLAEQLVAAWHGHNCVPAIPPDEDEVLHAQRLVAQRCLYGVDKNPMAVDLAKMALWLATLAKDHPFTFVDHSLRHGDSLVGLTFEQIRKFHWKPAEKEQLVFGAEELARRVREAEKHRSLITDSGDDATHLLKEQKYKLAEEALNTVRFAGNLAVAAFFAGANDKARKLKREDYYAALGSFFQTLDMKLRPTVHEAALRSGPHPVIPFHWEIEFPEVFSVDTPGFDSIVGNPPFMGGSVISSSFGMNYFDWLTIQFPPAGHLCDLVAYFFRRSFDLIRSGATIGFVATNTVSQGDTREGGLGEIVKQGGVIYSATKRYRWPGLAAVVVSIVHISKHKSVPAQLDGKNAKRISSYLLARGGDESPSSLVGLGELWSLGTKIYGAGFLFEDGTDESTPIDAMKAILIRHPDYDAIIRPYIGGVELNTHPSHEHSRFVINLNDVAVEASLDEWPELRDIIRDKVKPARDALGSNPNNTPLKKRWWAFQGHRPQFYHAARQLRRVLAQSQVSGHLGFAFQPTDRIFANTLNLFLFDSYGAFTILQARPHEAWARFFASSMKDDLRYTPSDCFETFPFPEGFESNPTLEVVGQTYYEFRAALMVRNDEGLTKTYNRFHDPDERSLDILKLRELHDAMDRAVLASYGMPFSDLPVPPCEFLLDYEDDDDEEEPSAKRRKKKPWRYRWPDTFRDEVLALLLDLNKQRAQAEKATAATKPKPVKAGRKKKEADDKQQLGMFDTPAE